MFKSRTRKIIRDVLSRKGRTAMAAMAIFVGVLGVVTLVGTGDIMMGYLYDTYQPADLPMLSVSVTVPGDLEIDNQAVLDTLASQPDVTNVEGRADNLVYFQVPTEIESDQADYDQGRIVTYSEPLSDVSIYPVQVNGEGHFPVAGQNEVAIDQRMADRYTLAVGDTLTLRVFGTGENTLTEEAWTISGILSNPYFTGGPTTLYAEYTDAQHIAGFAGFTDLYVRWTDFATAEANVPAFLDTLTAESPYLTQFTQIDNPDDSFIIRNNLTILSILNVLAIVALAVCGFLVTNIINTIIVEQKRQIGVMKSVGASRFDTIFMYAGIALVYGIIGTIPGVLLGILGAYGLAAMFANMSYITIAFEVTVTGALVGTLMGLFVPLLASIIPVFNGTRVSILDALTDLGIASNYGHGPLARVIARLPLPINIRQALSNVSRKKGRLVLTGITLTLAVASFMGVFAMTYSMNQLIGEIFGALGSEIQMVPGEAVPAATVRDALANVDGIETIAPGIVVPVQVDGYENAFDGSNILFLGGIDPTHSANGLKIEGAAWTEDPTRRGIVMSESLTDVLNKTTGDSLTFSLGGTSYTEEIIGISTLVAGDAIYMEWTQVAEVAGFVLFGTPIPTRFDIGLTEGQTWTAADIDEVLDQINAALLDGGVTAEMTNMVATAETQAQFFLIFGMVFGITGLVMAFVGAIGLLATLSMSVFERQKEIGVMRSIGARSRTIASQFLVEGLTVGVIAWIIGAPLSWLFASGLFAMLPFEGIDIPPYPVVALVFGLVGMLVIATAASLWPSLSASRKTVSEILRYQ